MHACKSPLAVYNMVEPGCGVSNKEKQKLPRNPFSLQNEKEFDCVFPVLLHTIRAILEIKKMF